MSMAVEVWLEQALIAQNQCGFSAEGNILLLTGFIPPAAFWPGRFRLRGVLAQS